jgi:hypothetical protein
MGGKTMERMQINMRIDKELAEAIDKKRIELTSQLQRIPTRTDVIKMALDVFLNDADKQPGKSKKTAK